MKRLIVDLDDTVSITIKGDYINSSPVPEIIAKLKEYKEVKKHFHPEHFEGGDGVTVVEF